ARRPPPTTRTRARCSRKGTVRSLPASRRPGLMRRTRHEPPYPPVAASRERAVGDRAGPAAAARTAAALAPVLAGTGGGVLADRVSGPRRAGPCLRLRAACRPRLRNPAR